MQNQEETIPQGSDLSLRNQKILKRTYISSGSLIFISRSTFDITVRGTSNRIIIMDESAGKLTLQGHFNQIMLRKSWLSLYLEGNRNLLTLYCSEFQLHHLEGRKNYIPGITEKRSWFAANHRLI
jgi:hypothetical protein